MSAWKRMMLALGLVDEYEEDEQASRARPPGNGPAPAGPPRPRQRPPSRPPGPLPTGGGRPPAPPPSAPGGLRTVPPGGGPRPGPRPGVTVRPGGRETVVSRAEVIEAREINDAKKIADLVRERIPVVVDLRTAEPDMARRVVDFSSGLAYALDGALTKAAKGVVLVSPPRVELSPREVSRLHALGLHDPPSG